MRTVRIDGEPWFVAADVCASLGLAQVSRAMSRLEEDEVRLVSVNAVSEPGLYQRMNETDLALFENYKIRRHFDEKPETWYFSIIDVVGAVTDSVNPRDYWFKMKVRVKSDDGFELSTICRQFRIKSPDGKMRLTDTANVQGLLRLVQLIPAPKAESIKVWLAKVGYGRMQDMDDPARSLDRAREYWQQDGRSEKVI